MRSHLERNHPPRVVPGRQRIAIGPDQRADCGHRRSLRRLTPRDRRLVDGGTIRAIRLAASARPASLGLKRSAEGERRGTLNALHCCRARRVGRQDLLSGFRGKAEGEARSTRRGIATDVAGVLLGDAAGDGEAEAVAGLAGIESNEALENSLAFALWYARPIIGDVRLGVAVASSYFDVDLAVGFDCGEGVVDEV